MSRICIICKGTGIEPDPAPKTTPTPAPVATPRTDAASAAFDAKNCIGSDFDPPRRYCVLKSDMAKLERELASARADTARINKLDRLLTEDSRFELLIRWHSSQDAISIRDGAGWVWGEAMIPNDATDEEGEGLTLRAAIDSIEGHKALRREPTEDDALSAIVEIIEKDLTDTKAALASAQAEIAECRRLLGEVYRNTNLRHHPELTGLADIVSKQLST